MKIDYIKLHSQSKSRKESKFIDFLIKINPTDIIVDEPKYGFVVNTLKTSLYYFDFAQPEIEDAQHSEEDLQIIERVVDNIYTQIGTSLNDILIKLHSNMNITQRNFIEHNTKGDQK